MKLVHRKCTNFEPTTSLRVVGDFTRNMTWSDIKDKIITSFDVEGNHENASLILNGTEVDDSIGSTLDSYLKYRPNIGKLTISVCIDDDFEVYHLNKRKRGPYKQHIFDSNYAKKNTVEIEKNEEVSFCSSEPRLGVLEIRVKFFMIIFKADSSTAADCCTACM